MSCWLATRLCSVTKTCGTWTGSTPPGRPCTTTSPLTACLRMRTPPSSWAARAPCGERQWTPPTWTPPSGPGLLQWRRGCGPPRHWWMWTLPRSDGSPSDACWRSEGWALPRWRMRRRERVQNAPGLATIRDEDYQCKCSCSCSCHTPCFRPAFILLSL